MTDKEKIRNYACKLLKDAQNGFGSASYNMLKMVIGYIDSIPKEPVSKDLEAEIVSLSKQLPEVSFAKLSRIAVRVAKWQKEQMMKGTLSAFVCLNETAHNEELPDHCVITDEETKEAFDKRGLKVGDKVKVIIVKED